MPAKYYGANATLSNISTTSFSQPPIPNANKEAKKTMNVDKKEPIKKTSSPKIEQPTNSSVTNSSVNSSIKTVNTCHSINSLLKWICLFPRI